VDIIPLIDCFGVDAVRYFLIRDMVVGLDSSFSVPLMVKRINSDLANDFGNLFSRVAKLVHDHFDGKTPAPNDSPCELRDIAAQVVGMVRTSVDDFSLHALVEEIMQLVRATNRYFEANAPWKLVKSDLTATGNVLYNCAEALRIAAVLLSPIMPERTAALLSRFGEANEQFALDEACIWGRLRPGSQFEKGDALFPRIDEKQLPKLLPSLYDQEAKSEAEAAEDESNLISIDDFSRLDLRSAKVTAAWKHPKADKLLILKLELKNESRQIVAGIAEFYEPEQLVDRSVVIVANLKPRELRGEQSQGMLLTAKSGKRLKILTIDGDISSGSKVG
jgi:methionyl-tRNA synthetase